MEETLPTTCPFCGHDSLTYQGNMVACTYPQHSPTDFCPRHGQWRPIPYMLRLIEKQKGQAREGEST